MNPAFTIRRSRRNVLFSGLKVKSMSRFTMTQENSPSVINLTVLNLHKERTDKFALPKWQINLLFATLIGKEIIQESIIPYPHFRGGGHHPLLFKKLLRGPWLIKIWNPLSSTDKESGISVPEIRCGIHNPRRAGHSMATGNNKMTI